MKRRLVQKLEAIDESGRPVTVHIFQAVIDTSDMRCGRSKTLGGLKEAFTADGRDVNYVDEKLFQVVQSGEKLRIV